MNGLITEKQTDLLTRTLIKNYRKLIQPIETLTREQAGELILHLENEKRYKLKYTESLIKPMTVKEFNDSNIPIYTKAEIADLLQPIANRFKIINKDIIKNAIKVFNIKEIGQEDEDIYYHSNQTVNFLREKLKNWEEFEKALYYLDMSKFTPFKNRDEYNKKLEEWELPTNQLFTWKKYNQCVIVGYDQYDRAILRLKPETTLFKAVNISWFKTFN